MLTSKQLTADRLRKELAYAPLTGVFTWLVSNTSSIKVGDIAGGTRPDGYATICVLSQRFLAHRLAWLYMHGKWPSAMIDHIDGNPGNNAISNLRDVSRSVNAQNQRAATSQSTHGFLGVSRDGKRWRSVITVAGKQRYIGQFDTPELAHTAYINAKRELHEGNTL